MPDADSGTLHIGSSADIVLRGADGKAFLADTTKADSAVASWAAAKKISGHFVPLLSVHGQDHVPEDSLILTLGGYSKGTLNHYLFVDSTNDLSGSTCNDTIIVSGMLPYGISQCDSAYILYRTSTGGNADTTAIIDIRVSVTASYGSTAPASQVTNSTDLYSETAWARTRTGITLSADTDFKGGEWASIELITKLAKASSSITVYGVWLVCQ